MGHVDEFFHGAVGKLSGFVTAGVCGRGEDIGDGNDPCELRNGCRGEAIRIAFAVEAFVVLISHEAGDGGEAGDLLEHGERVEWMLLDALPVGLAQFRGAGADAFGHGEHSDIAQERTLDDFFDHFEGEAHVRGDRHGEDGNG